jgi:hypothetical protein
MVLPVTASAKTVPVSVPGFQGVAAPVAASSAAMLYRTRRPIVSKTPLA